MPGTIILTGANGSAGIHAAEHLLKNHPDFTALLTVRDSSDGNSRRLRDVISQFPKSRASVLQLDLADLSSVASFAAKTAAAIKAKEYPPLKAIICNAFYWNLVEGPEMTVDNYDKSIQIGHISHVSLVLRLMGSFATDSSGRIVILSSISHYRQKTHMSPFLPDLPVDLDELVHPPAVPEKDRAGRGFTRYGNAKLLATTWMYPLNRYLSQSPKFRHVSAVAINPGGLGDSRCFQSNTPKSIQLMARFVLKPLMPIITRLDPTFRSAAAAGVDIIELAVNKAHPDYRGYLTMLQKDESDPLTRDEEAQHRVWQKSAEWAHITADQTALDLS